MVVKSLSVSNKVILIKIVVFKDIIIFLIDCCFFKYIYLSCDNVSYRQQNKVNFLLWYSKNKSIDIEFRR